MGIKILTIVLSSLIFIGVIELVREEKLTFKYALGWLVVSGTGIILAIFDKILFKIAHFFGFELTSNFIFFSLLSVFVFLTLLMTIFLCQQNNRNDRMAQKLGALRFEIEELKKKMDATEKNKI